MGISPRVVDALRKQEHDAVHLWERGLGALPDSGVPAKAREEGRVLLTADLDFGHLMAASRHLLPSVVLFRLPDMTPASVMRHLEAVLNDYSEELLRGAFAVVTELTTRVRHLPIGQDSDEPTQ